MSALRFGGVLAASIVIVAPAVRAQESLSLAEQRYRRGVELFMSQHYADALNEFQLSLQLFDSPNARLFVARCLDRLNRPVQALAEYEHTMRDADERARSDRSYAPTRDAARDEMRRVEQRVGRLVVTVANAPDGLHVVVEGNAIPVAALGLPLPVAPGPVNVSVTAIGFETFERQVIVAAGRRESIAVTLRASAVAVVASAAPAPAAPVVSHAGDAPRSSPLVGAGWAMVALGAAGLVTFGVTYAFAVDQYNRLDVACPAATGCTSSPDAEVARGRALEIGAYAGLGVGILGVGLGIAFLAAGHRSETRPHVVFAPGYIGVTGVF